MKPSDFILNSDYLSIAQLDAKEYTVYVGGGSLQIDGYTEQNFNFTTSTQQGVMDRILIKKDNQDYLLGAYMELFPTWNDPGQKVSGFIHVFRPDSKTIRAQLVLENRASEVSSYPSMTFTIKVSSFEPPNIF